MDDLSRAYQIIALQQELIEFLLERPLGYMSVEGGCPNCGQPSIGKWGFCYECRRLRDNAKSSASAKRIRAAKRGAPLS